MKRLHKFLRLPSTDQSLLIKAMFTVAAIRVGLWLLPFRTLRRFLARVTRKTTDLQDVNQAVIDRVIWAVTVASRYVPHATCLTQALAVQTLLARRGCPARFHIGVAKGQDGRLEAHAWVESQGRVVVGNLRDLSRYTALPPLDGQGR